ncbi:MAG TPA: DUF1049 domain-containing protein [Rhodanobacteraceae bacterium]|nr:DUF1049 domain-containing protein [Rhodanobacteraceae bacterium]
MRLLAIILIVLFALAGVAFGALNADFVSYDLIVASVRLPKGAALLAALLLGWVLGGLLVWLVALAPTRRRLAKARRALAVNAAPQEAEPPAA